MAELSDFVQQGIQSEGFCPQGLESRGQLGKACNSGAGSRSEFRRPWVGQRATIGRGLSLPRAGRGAILHGYGAAAVRSAPRFDHSPAWRDDQYDRIEYAGLPVKKVSVFI